MKARKANTRAALQVGIVMGSSSDWEVMQHAVAVLTEFGIAHEMQVLSAHRMPDEMFAYAESAVSRGLQVIIAGAGGAAHLPGMLAAKTIVPVPMQIITSCAAWSVRSRKCTSFAATGLMLYSLDHSNNCTVHFRCASATSPLMWSCSSR